MNTELEIERIKNRLSLLEGLNIGGKLYPSNTWDVHICDWDYYYGYRICRYCGKREYFTYPTTPVYPVYPVYNPPITWCCGVWSY